MKCNYTLSAPLNTSHPYHYSHIFSHIYSDYHFSFPFSFFLSFFLHQIFLFFIFIFINYFHPYHSQPIQRVCHITLFQKSRFCSIYFFYMIVKILFYSILIFIYIIWSGFFFFPSLTIYSFFLTNSHSFFPIILIPFFLPADSYCSLFFIIITLIIANCNTTKHLFKIKIKHSFVFYDIERIIESNSYFIMP